VKRVKRFVDVRLRCIVSNLKRISKIVDSVPPGKIAADARDWRPACCRKGTTQVSSNIK